jgi:hypothetical protein
MSMDRTAVTRTSSPIHMSFCRFYWESAAGTVRMGCESLRVAGCAGLCFDRLVLARTRRI